MAGPEIKQREGAVKLVIQMPRDFPRGRPLVLVEGLFIHPLVEGSEVNFARAGYDWAKGPSLAGLLKFIAERFRREPPLLDPDFQEPNIAQVETVLEAARGETEKAGRYFRAVRQLLATGRSGLEAKRAMLEELSQRLEAQETELATKALELESAKSD